MSKKVLDVGQCGFDHGRISHVLSANFDVDIVQAHSHDEALQLAKDQSFDLVMVNRLLDADQSPGMDVLKSIKADDTIKDTPVMVISNYDDAQSKAVEAGAVHGFGKASLDRPETMNLIAEYLG